METKQYISVSKNKLQQILKTVYLDLIINNSKDNATKLKKNKYSNCCLYIENVKKCIGWKMKKYNTCCKK